jgi:CoA-transferase family III
MDVAVADSSYRVLEDVLFALGADTSAGVVRFTGPGTVLPSIYDVTGFASATVAASALAAAGFRAARTHAAIPAVQLNTRAACAAFVSEQLFTPHGWELPAAWDPIAGVYETATGWIRLHTNYRYHRVVVETLLGADDRSGVAKAAAAWDGEELEAAIVDAGGCAAVMRTRERWLTFAARAAITPEPLVRLTHAQAPSPELRYPASPYSGVRVLDLTRVIAGPVATRTLAALGADVLRIDPPGFDEVPALLPETTVGKRTCSLDLRDNGDRRQFEALVASAHVIVTGLRAGALEDLGYDDTGLRALNPSLVIARLNAYGWDGQWTSRRGFDSLVQMSCGIAAAGGRARGSEAPFPLPAQALDHGTGYLVAAAVGYALTRQFTTGETTTIHASLIGTANFLMRYLSSVPLDAVSAPKWNHTDTVSTATAWGPARRVPWPATIDGVAHDWRLPAGPLAASTPTWAP